MIATHDSLPSSESANTSQPRARSKKRGATDLLEETASKVQRLTQPLYKPIGQILVDPFAGLKSSPIPSPMLEPIIASKHEEENGVSLKKKPTPLPPPILPAVLRLGQTCAIEEKRSKFFKATATASSLLGQSSAPSQLSGTFDPSRTPQLKSRELSFTDNLAQSVASERPKLDSTKGYCSFEDFKGRASSLSEFFFDDDLEETQLIVFP